MKDTCPPQRNNRFLTLLFNGGSSKTGRQDILKAFDYVDEWQKASQACSFYQGCGKDVATLTCNSVDTHILSDYKSEVAADLAGTFNRLATKALISNLVGGNNQWHFTLGRQDKSVYFTTDPIERIDFSERFGKPLGVVFEWNCGDSAKKQSFWRAVRQQLIEGGYVIGSYASRIDNADRMAFVLDTSGEEPCLQGTDHDDDADRSIHIRVIDEAKRVDRLPKKVLQRRTIDIGNRAFEIRCIGKDRFSISTIWRQPVSAFGLELKSRGEKVCTFIKKRWVAEAGAKADAPVERV